MVENQYSLERVVNEGASRAILSAQEYLKVEDRFIGAVEIVNQIKGAMGQYLASEDAFLQASGIEGKVEGIKKVALTVWCKLTGEDPKTYSIGRQLNNLLGVFAAYHTKITDEVENAKNSFDETERHVDELLEAQIIIKQEITDVLNKSNSLKTEYDGLTQQYTEVKSSREEKGEKSPSDLELALQKQMNEKQREYESADSDFNQKAMAAAIAENTYELMQAYRKTAKIVVDDASETARNLNTIEQNLAPLMKYVIATAELTEIHARGVNAYVAVKAIVNKALPALAHLGAATSEMRDAAMLGRPFIEGDTLEVIRQIGDGLEDYRNKGRQALMERVATQRMLTKRTDDSVIDAETVVVEES